MWEINISRSSVDSLRTLQSKLSPPGERPPCSNTVWEKYGQIYYLKKKKKQKNVCNLVYIDKRKWMSLEIL